MTTAALPLCELPTAGTLDAVRRIAAKGFLAAVGELWQQHGDLFRVTVGGRRLVFAMHPDAVRHISITQRANYEKLDSYDIVRRYLLGRGMLTSSGDLWRQQRRLMAPFYTPRAVQTYADLMLRDGERLIARWDERAARDPLLDIPLEMALITASIILRAMFSMDSDEQIASIKDDVEAMIVYVARQQVLPVRLPRWVPTALNRRYNEARARTHAYIAGVIAQRRQMPPDAWPDDLLSRLMEAEDSETGHRMSADLVRDEAITTFFAGHETTARTLTFVWYALAENPAIAQRLHAELDAALGDGPVTLEALHRLPYTLQVIKETMRLYPPAPFYVRDAIADDTIDGTRIPAGSAVMLSPYYTHRHPDFWPDPLRFDPDRWTPEAEAARHPTAYHPFAAGQRICIGNNFSLLETHLLLALLARRYTLSLPPGYAPRWVMEGTLSLANGLTMQLARR